MIAVVMGKQHSDQVVTSPLALLNNLGQHQLFIGIARSRIDQKESITADQDSVGGGVGRQGFGGEGQDLKM